MARYVRQIAIFIADLPIYLIALIIKMFILGFRKGAGIENRGVTLMGKWKK